MLDELEIHVYSIACQDTLLYCTQPPHAEATKLLCPHHEGAGFPPPIRVGGPDLLYQMALVDTTVEQSLISSAEGTRGSECVRCEGTGEIWEI